MGKLTRRDILKTVGEGSLDLQPQRTLDVSDGIALPIGRDGNSAMETARGKL